MNERLQQLRKTLKLSQEAFGKKLGVSKSAVSNMESGRYNMTDTVLKLACQSLNVSEKWLKTGKGDMFINPPPEELERLAQRYSLSEEAKNFVKTFVELDTAEMDVVLKFMGKIKLKEDEPIGSHETGFKERLEQAQSIVSDELCLTKEEPEQQPNKWTIQTDKMQAILDRQKEMDKKHNSGSKKEKLSYLSS